MSERFRRLRAAVYAWLAGTPPQLQFHRYPGCQGHKPHSRAAKAIDCPDLTGDPHA